jgi:pimeloyl-ACP methyl ester carboxylesterase
MPPQRATLHQPWWYTLHMQSKYIKIDNYRLHYLDAGSGPAVLLLHGFAGSAEDWRPSAEILANAGYRALAFDCLGFGRSDKPGDAPYSLELIAGLYATALRQLDITQASIVAHSMGGKYALATALFYPTLVTNLTLIATDGFGETSPLTRIGGWPLAGRSILWLSAQPPIVRAMLGATFYDPEKYVNQELIARARAALLGPENLRALTALSRRYDATDLQLSGLRARLGEIQTPTLLAWGSHDQVFPVAQANIAATEIPNAGLAIFPRCGHFPQVEAARSFHGLLFGFLAMGQTTSSALTAHPGHKENF